MIAVDTNVLVGAIQTFELQLRSTARGAVKSLHTSSSSGTPLRGQLMQMVSVSLPNKHLDTWIAFRRSCDSFLRRRRFSQLGES
jgi:hypothetical protein